MKQITEDYCSYEIAKLLKEKGFYIPCRQAYFNGSLVDYTMYGFCDGELLDCPSQSLALKWLREIYHCHVTIEYVFKADAKLTNDYVSYCFSVENANTFIEFTQDEWYDTYEEAVEAAILYVLKNLI